MATDEEIVAGVVEGSRCPCCRAYWTWCRCSREEIEKADAQRHRTCKRCRQHFDGQAWKCCPEHTTEQGCDVMCEPCALELHPEWAARAGTSADQDHEKGGTIEP